MITLLYFGDTLIEWELGSTIQLQRDVKNVNTTIRGVLDQNIEGWIFLWDFDLGIPDVDVLQKLTERPVDAWHAGVKLGLGDLPEILNYVHPTWMYNKNGPAEIEHTSFRLSICAALIRIDTLRKVGLITSGYSSLAMYGVALGYKLLKSGAVIRYTPDLVKPVVPVLAAIDKDEWIFASEFFSKKWQAWSLLSRRRFTRNLKDWLSARSTKPQVIKPVVHSSEQKIPTVKHESVSVLAPTLNRYSYLLNELEQLSKQSVLPVEVLITDQTDEAERVDMDFSKFHKLTIRYFRQNEKGQCLAWNKLLREAKGDYVLFLGDDADDIKPDFIEKLLSTRQRFDCDMVASNVIEVGIPLKPLNPYYFLSDTFPITLIKRSLVAEAGFMDMFFNKNIRADHDLAMRCHLRGAIMMFDSSAIILHHRAPSGGLRTHNARVITNHMAKRSITRIAVPTSSEIYLAKKYYTQQQYKSYIRIKYLNQLLITGGFFRRLLRGLVFTYKLPLLTRSYKENKASAERALALLDSR